MARPSKIFIIADTHFNHETLVTMGERPADYQEQIVRNWKRLVMSHDIVIHLGDVIFARASTLGEIMAGLPGVKILVRGNHDRESDGWYLRNGFSVAVQGLLIGGVWLTHAPQAALPDGALINVHGHLHGGHHRSTAVADHCKLFALETHGYTPIDLQEFVGFTPLTRRIIMPYEIDAD
jgi:calcineurin-like phosphoesterase family protein